MKRYLLLLLVSLSTVASAQVDTFYFDKGWQECDPEIASYKRVFHENIGGSFIVQDYYDNNVLYSEGKYNVENSQTLKNTLASAYRNGNFSFYNIDGLLIMTGKYKKGEKDGVWEYYNYKSQVKKKKEFDRNVLLTTNCFSAKNNSIECDTIVYSYVDSMPRANYAMANYLNENLVYPESAKKNNISGRVIVSFVVDEDGDITKVRSQSKDASIDLQKEAKRVVRKMPSWEPGYKNGIPVAVSYAVPVTFKIAQAYKADTFFFDKRWRSVAPDAIDLEYYRVVRNKKNSNEPFVVRDYYRSGDLQMSGTYYVGDLNLLDKPEANIFRSGFFTYYYRGGRKKREGLFSYGQKDGTWVSYYDDDAGSVEDVMFYKLGKRDSIWKFYNEVGALVRTESYKNNKKHGVWKDYYKNGELMMEEEYENGLLVGDLKRYYDDGTLSTHLVYKNGNLDHKECFNGLGVLEECSIEVDEYNGMDAIYMLPIEYGEDIIINEVELENARVKKTEGKVIIELAIDEEGYVVEINSRSPEVDVALQIKAIRRAAQMPDPKKAMLTVNGAPRKVYLSAPFLFVTYY
ncbi:MAG: TonB family protein [Flavipsychrobacter sp.]